MGFTGGNMGGKKQKFRAELKSESGRQVILEKPVAA